MTNGINENTKVWVRLRYIVMGIIALVIMVGTYFASSQAAQNVKIDQKVNVAQYNIDQDRLWERLDQIYTAVTK